ncbi:MAG TPA: hypothetical protein VG167_22970 [Verrucomicrobiae bacterium]|nr:hypothetical protein [Verrucomicrobiae bacterium]
MNPLPLIHRELLSGARQRATYWIRCAVALVGVLICMQSMNAGLGGTPATLGQYVFNAVIAAAFLVSCSVCLLSADAISLERREGTLELLFLTGVKPVDVLLGKLGSVGLTSFCSLLAFLPALAVPLLAGGVTGGEALRKGLALLNLMFFALVAGLSASASQSDRFRASRAAVILVSLVVLVPFFVLAVATRAVPVMFGLLSPLSTVIMAGESRYFGAKSSFWLSLLFVQALTWGLLILAGLRLRAMVKSRGGGDEARLPDPAKAKQAVGLMSWQPGKEDSGPVEWLVYRRFSVGAGLWGLASVALAYNGWVPLTQTFSSRRGVLASWIFAWPFAVTAGLIGGAIVAWVASRFFVGVRRSGDLELLMSTPVGAATIVSDQWGVLQRLFVWPVLVMQAPMLPQIVASLGTTPLARAGAGLGALTLYKVLSLANIFLGVAALCWAGLWFGLKARSQAAAIAWAVALAKGLPALVSLVGILLAEAMPGRNAMLGSAPALIWLPEAVNLVYYLWFIWFARLHLTQDLADAEPLPFYFPESWDELRAALRSLFATTPQLHH